MSSIARAERPRDRRLPAGLVVATLVYLALRVLILHTAFDSVAMWMYELYPMGTIAELSLRGIDFPLKYSYANAAGQLLFGGLAIPSFWLFGSSYLALKLATFLVGLATLFLVWGFLDASFGRLAANLGALLFALAPPTLLKYSLICSGNHFENLFFTMLALVCAYRLHRRPESRGRLFASAYSAGFALFVFLGALIPVGILAAMHVGLRGIRRTLRDLPWILCGFGLGILPLVVISAATGARGLGFLGAKFGEAGPRESGRALARTGAYLGIHLPRATVFEPFGGFSRESLGWIHFAAFAVAYLACLPWAARGAAALLRGLVRPAPGAFASASILPVVLYAPLAALAFGLSNLRVGGYSPPIEVGNYRYFLPTLLFGLLAIAIVGARLWESGGFARAGAAALLVPAFFTALSGLTIVDWTFTRPGLGPRYRGYDLSKVSRALLSPTNAVPREEAVRFVEGLPPTVREEVIRAIGFNDVAVRMLRADRRKDAGGSAEPAPGSGPVPCLDLGAVLADRPESWRNDLALGAGIGLRFYLLNAGRSAVEAVDCLAQSRGLDAARARPWFPAALGACTPSPSLPLESVSQSWIDSCRELSARASELPDAETREFFRSSLASGRGVLCGRLYCRGIREERESVLAELRSIPGELEGSFHLGLGIGVAEQPEPVRIPEGLLPEIPERARAAFWEGFGRGLRSVRDRDVGRIAAPIRAGLAGAELEALDRGLR